MDYDYRYMDRDTEEILSLSDFEDWTDCYGQYPAELFLQDWEDQLREAGYDWQVNNIQRFLRVLKEDDNMFVSPDIARPAISAWQDIVHNFHPYEGWKLQELEGRLFLVKECYTLATRW